jgi:hypothetical protein
MLLENALDALDRLFDRESSVIEVEALLFATAEALRGTPHEIEFRRAVDALQPVLASSQPTDDLRDHALSWTDGLRRYLARLLPVQ